MGGAFELTTTNLSTILKHERGWYVDEGLIAK
jgi:hypothetical protein